MLATETEELKNTDKAEVDVDTAIAELENSVKNQMEKLQIRATPDVIEDFKELTQKYAFKSQGTALASLISTYNLANAQSLLIDRQTEIQNFSTLIHKIEKAYTDSLELFETAKDTVKIQFEDTISQKDMLIQQLTLRSKELDDKYKKLQEEYKSTEQESVNEFERAERLQGELTEIKEREKVLLENFSKLNPKSELLEANINEQASQINELKKQVKQLEQTNHELSDNLSKSKNEYLDKAKGDLQELEASRKDVQNLTLQVNNLMYFYNLYIKEHPEQAMQQPVQQG